jgi:D-alanyl-D-alanine carboxypeptidase/D-alanyl-D-alanine-endopeptidase (penicillin-binding protein 4)
VVVVMLAAYASYRFNLGYRWFGFDHPSPINQPAQIAPPAGLVLPAARPAPSVAPPTGRVAVDRRSVRDALTGLVGKASLGRHVIVRVAQMSDGSVVYQRGTGRITPASTMKLLTTTAALKVLGPAHRFVTTVVNGRTPKTIVLVGGGDPLLSRRPENAGRTYPSAGADLASLAGDTADALAAEGRVRVRLRYDASLFRGPAVSPHWPGSYRRDDVVSPISALWYDEGRKAPDRPGRYAHPAIAAAQAFAQALRHHGIKVLGRIRPGRDLGGPVLAQARSAPLQQIVEHILEVSDNEGAEVLARQVAIATGWPASFGGAVHGITQALDALGVDTSGDTFFDGSGLSRQDRLTPRTLLEVIETDAQHPQLRGVLTGLPVAGFTGSLAYRFTTGDPDGPGLVRAKTGTLTGVSGLAGTVTSVDGTDMAFLAMADKIPVRDTLDARADLDDIAAALAECTCAAAGG